MLFVGKLEPNKGAHLLPLVMRAAREAMPGRTLPTLVIAGNGALDATITRQCAQAGVAVRILEGWTDHDDVLRLMRRAEALLFPSAWGEPLSRVLLEASAVGACIVAMPTGGTPEIIEHGVNGMLASDAAQLGRTLAHTLLDQDLTARLRAGAMRRARAYWTPGVVAAQVESIYEQVMQ